MADRQEKEARFWDRIADLYDRYIDRDHGREYKRFRKIFFKYVKRKHKVLDVATGTGDMAFILAKRSKDVTGIDISNEMIRHAKAKAEVHPAFLVDDAYDIDFERGTFDLVTCCNGLHVMQEPSKALAEMRRVLKSRGKLVTITFAYGDASLSERLRLLGQSIRIGRPGYWHNFTGKQLRRLHTEAGFKVLKCEYCWKGPPAVLTVARR